MSKPLIVDVPVQFNAPQFAAYEAFRDDNTVFLGWGRGVGKSKFIRLCWWILIAQWEHRLRTSAIRPFKGVRITVLMPTLKQFKDVHWSGIMQELSGEWAFLGAKLDRQTGQIEFPGGSFVKPFPASEYNARTALGLRTDVLVIDECDDVPAGVYDAVAQPWLSEPWSLKRQLIAGTPNKGRHGLWWRTLQQGMVGERIRDGKTGPLQETDESDAKYAARLAALATIFAFRATYADSPEMVSPVTVAKARATMPLATFKREWEADPDAGEGLVYPFDESFHVRYAPELRVFSEFLVGVDHGWTDPGCLLLCGVKGHGNDAELWVLDERYETETPDHVWDSWAADWRVVNGHLAQFWADKSRPDRIDAIRATGCNIQPGDSNPGSVAAGISRIADLLFIRATETVGPDFSTITRRYARLYVTPNCRNTIREFGLYRRKKLPDGSFSEEPEDKNNHALDALRYVALGRFGRPQSGRYEAPGR